MATDFSKPVVTDGYAALLPGVQTAISDLARGLDPTLTGTSTNVPTGAKRFNESTGWWERYNGISWVLMSMTGNFGAISANATGAAVSLSGASTGNRRIDIGNSGQTSNIGVESSTGSAIVTGSTAYATVINSGTNVPVQIGVNSSLVGSFSSTGLAVTGTLSAATLKVGGGSATPSAYLANVTPSGTEPSLELYQTGIESWKLKNPASTTDLILAQSGVSRVSWNGATGLMNVGAGLAVTGTLSATSDLMLSATDGKILGGTSAGRAIWGNSGTTAYITAYGASHATNANQLIFVSNGNTATLDASGNLGLGVTPSAWYSSGSPTKALQIGAYSSFYQEANGYAGLSSNAYESGLNIWKYSASLGASRYESQFGNHYWYTAPSGTAGTAITFTQQMSLDATNGLVLALMPKVTALISMVRLTGFTGYGSTNTCIARFTTAQTNQGSDITYADSATLGATFTINTSGVYTISQVFSQTSANWVNGISIDSAQLTTSIAAITAANRLAIAQTYAANAISNCSWTGYIAAGSVVRSHTDGGASGATCSFTITRVA